MLDAEHFSRAREAGLHLVGDEQDPVLVAHPAQPGQQLVRRLVEPALALDRFDDDRGDTRRLDVGAKQKLQRAKTILDADAVMLDGEGEVVDFRRKRPEAALVGQCLARHGTGQDGAAVEGA